jgi:bifunctional DNA-binding transcriptional regulator/antitoxin component of YhaV-PrlF toxin-antitoxin module
MKKVQRTMKGVYYVEIPSEIIRLLGWKEGDQVEFLPGNAIAPRREDLLLRRKSL